MGDVGGLYDGLGSLIHLLLKPLAVMALNSELLTLAFKLVKGKSTDETAQRIQIPERIFFLSISLCGKRSRYRKMLDRADATITRHLDLVKFVH